MLAQNVIPITKAEVFTKVAQENSSIKIAHEDFNQAQADYRQTNAIFLPTIAVSHTGIATNNPVMAFGSKLNQGVFSESDFGINNLNNPKSIENFTTSFQIEQPLLNFDGFHQRKASKNKMEAMALQTERARDYLFLEVEKRYMELQLAYKAVEVLEKALQSANANQKSTNDLFTQGYLQRADVLSMEVRVTEVESQLQQGYSAVKNASDYLSYLMNDETTLIFSPLDSLIVSPTHTEHGTGTISPERSDLKALQMATNAYEASYKADKMAFLPSLNAFGSYDLYDAKAFQGQANSYVVGAQLNWTILEGTKRTGKAQKSRSELEKSKLQYEQYLYQSTIELNKADRMLLDAKNKLTLTALALEQSRESLRIRTNRFKEGLEKPSDVLMAETQYAQKQLEYYQTIFEHNYAYAYLQFLLKEH